MENSCMSCRKELEKRHEVTRHGARALGSYNNIITLQLVKFMHACGCGVCMGGCNLISFLLCKYRFGSRVGSTRPYHAY